MISNSIGKAMDIPFEKNEDNTYLDSLNFIGDCFYISIECIKVENGYSFIVDSDGNIIAVYNFKSKNQMGEYIGKKINSKGKFDPCSEILNELKSVQELSCFAKTVNIGMKEYGIHLLLDENENFDTETIFKEICRTMGKTINLFNKYRNEDKLILKALDSVNEGISFCDRDGNLIYVNESCCEILDTTKEEIVGEKIDKLAKGKPLLGKIIETKKSIIDVEYFLKFKDKTVQLINSGYPVFDGNKNIIGAIDIFRSIERSRKLTSAMAGYEAFFTYNHIIGEDEKLAEVIKLSKAYARSSENILIIGESGTGKELFAQAIHNYSSRRNKPFIALNCASFPDELVDSELFGYEEGAFTGAKKGGKPGKFELANGGTLFLDELGEMSIHIQAKLLRVLETMSINRIGGTRPFQVDVRIIAATNRKLEKLVEEGKFRSDLYYRLKVLYIEVPPLRERGRDIIILADYFIKKFNEKMQKGIKGLTQEAKEIIMNNCWQGNIRELENTLSRCMYLCDGEFITKETIEAAGLKQKIFENVVIREKISVNKENLIDLMKHTNGNKKKASQLLGISRPTLYKLLKEYRL